MVCDDGAGEGVGPWGISHGAGEDRLVPVVH